MGKVVFCCCLQKKQVCPIQLFASKSNLTTKFFKLRYLQNFENSNIFSNFHFFFCFEIKIFKKAESWNQMQIPFNEKKRLIAAVSGKSQAHLPIKYQAYLSTHRRIIKLVDLPNRKIKSFRFIYIPSHLDEISTQIEIESI